MHSSTDKAHDIHVHAGKSPLWQGNLLDGSCRLWVWAGLTPGTLLKVSAPGGNVRWHATPDDTCCHQPRVSFETSFDSKQPKLEPKLVSALSETKRLFWLFHFYTETEIFDVSIEPKQTEDQPKQFDMGHILLFFTENLEFFRFFLGFFDFFGFFGFFRFFRNSLFRLFCFYTETDSFNVSIEPKQTEDPPKQLKVSGYFSENVGLFRFVTKQFCLFRLFWYRFETPKQTEVFSFWFHETNRNKRETDLVSVCFGSNRNLFLFVSRTPYISLCVPLISLCSTCQREKV
jgi:hypothetical protein